MMFVSLVLFGSLVSGEKDFEAKLQPGHAKQQYDSLEEVRGHDNETTSDKTQEDDHVLREAILDVAYYLRRFKFSGHDPRYLSLAEVPKQNLFVEFPSPPLRNIHWEVKKNCEPSFGECVKYLQEQVSQTLLPRHLDSLTITKQNGWSFIKDRDLIKSADDECLKRLENDEKTFTVFSGPVQKFQWLTSASYYMCLYTMKEVAPLKGFGEDCDNFGSCIPWEVGLGNKDVRGDNRQLFACASYSFCPDPCCPLKHLPDWSACQEANPCRGQTAGDKTCTFSRKNNLNFESMIMNQWNVTCNCDGVGMRWESKSGMCVDVDECTESVTSCDHPSESCRNLPGSYKCVCSVMGYRNNPETKVCEPDPVTQSVFYPSHASQPNKTDPYLHKVRDYVGKLKTVLSKSSWKNESEFNKTEISTIT